jgi:hypothetical protein
VGHVVVEQLPVVVARVARPYTGASLADEIDVRRDTVLRATGFCGLAACFGASTKTLGSEVVAPPEGVAVCAIAVPLRPHSGATARLATKKSDESFTFIPPMSWDGKCQSQSLRYLWTDANLSHRLSLRHHNAQCPNQVIASGRPERVAFRSTHR